MNDSGDSAIADGSSVDFLPPGTPVDLDNCAREPIHQPGSIQPEGVLLCARLSDGIVVQASANTETVFAWPVKAVLGMALGDLLGADALGDLVRRSGISAPNRRPLRLVIGSGDNRHRQPCTVDAFAYEVDDALLVVELEIVEGSASPQFEHFQDQVTSSLERRRDALLEQVAQGVTIAAGLASSEVDLLGICGAAGAAIKVNDELYQVGQTPSAERVHALAAELSG